MLSSRLVEEAGREARRGIDERLRRLDEADDDRQRSLQRDLALHDAGNRAELLFDDLLPKAIFGRQYEGSFLRLRAGDDARVPADTAVEIEPDAHVFRHADRWIRRHYQSDATMRPLDRRLPVVLTRTDRRPVGSHPFR